MLKTVIITALLFTTLLMSSCGSPDDKVIGKWKIEKITDLPQDKMKEMGLDKIYLELNADKTLKGYWFDVQGGEEFAEQSGKWMYHEMEIEGAIGDLFLQFDGGQDIIEVTSINENEMVLNDNSENIKFTFSKN